MRLLVANEPQAYRQAIAGTVGKLRPDVEVLVASPSDDLDNSVVCLVPDMVICSQLTPAIESSRHAWVLLYPDGETRTVISIGGQRTTSADMEFDELLAVIDRASATQPAWFYVFLRRERSPIMGTRNHLSDSILLVRKR